jgi:hypothetical protein
MNEHLVFKAADQPERLMRVRTAVPKALKLQ